MASGSLIPREDIAIFPQLTGYRVAKVLVDEGAWVKAGQPLAQIDDSLLRAQLDQQTALAAQQKARPTEADAEAARVKGLDTQGLLAQEQIDSRRFAARGGAGRGPGQSRGAGYSRPAKPDDRGARAGGRAGHRTQCAPGRHERRRRTPWFRIAQDGQIELAADVSEEALGKIHPG